MSGIERFATAVFAGLTAAVVLPGCGLFHHKACPAVAESAVRVEFEDESGDPVAPESVTVENDGETMSASPTCPRPGGRGFFSTGGTYTVRGTCGDETVTRDVEVSSDECGPETETVTLTFPEGACEVCGAGDNGGGDTGLGDTGASDTGPDAGGDSSRDTESSSDAG